MEYKDDTERAKVLLEEFKEAGHFHRLHVGLMFGQITVFMGASGALLHRLFGQPPLEPLVIQFFAGVGVFLALLFLVLHERVYAYSYGARKRAEEIQDLLQLSLYKHHETQFTFVRSLKAAPLTRILYFASAFIWLLIFFQPPLVTQKPTPNPAVERDCAKARSPSL